MNAGGDTPDGTRHPAYHRTNPPRGQSERCAPVFWPVGNFFRKKFVEKFGLENCQKGAPAFGTGVNRTIQRTAQERLAVT